MSHDGQTPIYVKRRANADPDAFRKFAESIDGVDLVHRQSPDPRSRRNLWYAVWVKEENVGAALLALRASDLVETAELQVTRNPSAGAVTAGPKPSIVQISVTRSEGADKEAFERFVASVAGVKRCVQVYPGHEDPVFVRWYVAYVGQDESKAALATVSASPLVEYAEVCPARGIRK